MRPYGLDYSVLFSENLGELGVKFLLAVKAAYHVALGVDDKLGGDILDGVIVGVVDGLVVDVDILLHAHTAVGDIFFPGLFAAVERHGEHLEALAVILLVNLLDVGSEARQGPHHVAQKSTSTTLPLRPERLTSLPSWSLPVISGAFAPGWIFSRAAIYLAVASSAACTSGVQAL